MLALIAGFATFICFFLLTGAEDNPYKLAFGLSGTLVFGLFFAILARARLAASKRYVELNGDGIFYRGLLGAGAGRTIGWGNIGQLGYRRGSPICPPSISIGARTANRKRSDSFLVNFTDWSVEEALQAMIDTTPDGINTSQLARAVERRNTSWPPLRCLM
jgi:hypothetical protein